MKLKFGVDETLEEAADALIFADRPTAHSEIRDILSVGQLKMRIGREVMPVSGVPDEAIFSGNYKRSWNPYFRSELANRKRARQASAYVSDRDETGPEYVYSPNMYQPR